MALFMRYFVPIANIIVQTGGISDKTTIHVSSFIWIMADINVKIPQHNHLSTYWKCLRFGCVDSYKSFNSVLKVSHQLLNVYYHFITIFFSQESAAGAKKQQGNMTSSTQFFKQLQEEVTTHVRSEKAAKRQTKNAKLKGVSSAKLKLWKSFKSDGKMFL